MLGIVDITDMDTPLQDPAWESARVLAGQMVPVELEARTKRSPVVEAKATAGFPRMFATASDLVKPIYAPDAIV